MINVRVKDKRKMKALGYEQVEKDNDFTFRAKSIQAKDREGGVNND